MTDLDYAMIKKMEKVIPLDGWVVVDTFFGKEEHFPANPLAKRLRIIWKIIGLTILRWVAEMGNVCTSIWKGYSDRRLLT